MVNVSWSNALKRTERTRKERRSHRSRNAPLLTDHRTHELESGLLPPYASRLWDENSEAMDLNLDALVNPSKVRKVTIVE